MIVSLHEYAIIFIIFDITLCFHIFLSILRRNREQIFEGFLCFSFIIPINIVNIIYFFLIKPIAILSSSVNLPKCFYLCIYYAVFATLCAVLIWLVDYFEFNFIVCIILFIVCIILYFIFDIIYLYLFELSYVNFFVIVMISPFYYFFYYLLYYDRIFDEITWRLDL